MNHGEVMKNLNILFFLAFVVGCSSNDLDSDDISVRDDSVVVSHEVELNSEYDSLYHEAANCVREKQYGKAEAIYSHLLTVEDDKTNALAGMAAVQLLLENTDKAIITYHELLALDSMNYFAQLGLGSCHYTNNDFKQAIFHYRKALLSSPESADGYRGLAISYSELDKKDSAAVNAQKFLLLAPNSSHRRNMENLINAK